MKGELTSFSTEFREVGLGHPGSTQYIGWGQLFQTRIHADARINNSIKGKNNTGTANISAFVLGNAGDHNGHFKRQVGAMKQGIEKSESVFVRPNPVIKAVDRKFGWKAQFPILIAIRGAIGTIIGTGMDCVGSHFVSVHSLYYHRQRR